MPRQYRVGTVVVVGAALLSAGAAQAQVLGRPGDLVPVGRSVFPRPTGASFGFTFRPLLQEPFRAGDRFPRDEARPAGRERTDLTADGTPERGDLLIDAPERFQPFRFDLLNDAPLSDRLDLLPDVPVDG